MLHAATTDLQHFLMTYGYLAVFVFVAIESIGIPFPGETMLLVRRECSVSARVRRGCE